MGYGGDTSGALLSLLSLPGNEGFWEAWGWGGCSSWKMRSYLREAGTRITCCALLKHVSLGRAATWQPPRLVPEEMGIAAAAAGRRPACASCPFPLSNDEFRPRSFKLGGSQGKPDLSEK